MARYQVILAYDGTAYCGFQRQAHSLTVQAVVEQALRRIGWRERTLFAAGRTDAGVHATGQVIAFDLEWKHSEQDLLAALNANFPPDIAASSVSIVDASFHPRYDAIARFYRYRIYCQPIRDPMMDRYHWRVWPAPELKLMQAAAELLIGTHDFAAFGNPSRKGGSTIRKVIKAIWNQTSSESSAATLLDFEIAADGFLNRMVRRLVYLQVIIGQGRQEPEVVSDYLTSPSRKMVDGQAPPHGLSLVEVAYREERSL